MDTGMQRGSLVDWTDCQWQIVKGRAIRLIGVLMLTLFATASPVQAAVEAVPPISGGKIWYNNGQQYPSADAACAATIWSVSDCYATGAVLFLSSVPGSMGCTGICPSLGQTKPSLHWAPINYSISAICPTATPAYTFNPASGMCERLVQDCPAHSSGTFPDACVCDTGYKVDPAGTSCVPVTDTCSIPGLTPLTDPVAIDFDNNPGGRWRPEGLSADYQVKLTCVTDGIDAATGRTRSYTGTSAYRPAQYQRHLFEIVDKDKQLRRPGYMAAHPECQTLRAEITRKMGPSRQGGHELSSGQPVATPGSSRHEAVPATAFDLTPIGLTKAQMAPIYARCGVKNTVVRNEPWHTQ